MFSHDFPFDPTYGYDETALLAVGLPGAPSDFAAFWQSAFAANAAASLNPTVTPADSPRSDLGISLVEYDTLDGYRIGAWIVYPEEGDIGAGFVASHGYGGRTAPDLGLLVPNAAAIFPCAPGFNLSASPDLPSEKMAHVIHGIVDRDSYLIRPCVTSIWSAATLLLELFPNIGSRLFFTGASFGGGLGALALPWDARFTKAHLKVPTFGHHPIRNACPCEGSGKSVADYAAAHPEAMDTLAYYDAATAASHIRIPVFAAPAQFDPKVPPPGQFAVTNALPSVGQRRILQAGHFEHPDLAAENAELRSELALFFTS